MSEGWRGAWRLSTFRRVLVVMPDHPEKVVGGGITLAVLGGAWCGSTAKTGGVSGIGGQSMSIHASDCAQGTLLTALPSASQSAAARDRPRRFVLIVSSFVIFPQVDMHPCFPKAPHFPGE